MKIKNKILFLLLFCLFFISSFSQTIQYAYQIVQSFTITGTQTGSIIGSGAAFHQITWNVSGTLTTCSVTIDSSPDGITWTVGGIIAAQTCTSNGQVLSTSLIVNYVRVNVSTLSGTGTLTVNLTGYSNSPAGGGGGGSAFPVTVSGTVNSGGIPYFSGATTETSSAALTQFGVLFGGGAGGAPTASAQGAANMPLLGNGAANPVFSTIAYLTTISGSGCLVFSSSTTQLACAANIAANKLVRAGGVGTAPNASSFSDGSVTNLASTTNLFTATNTVRLTANTSAITATTPGTAVLTFSTLPVSTNLSFHCHLLYNQQTAAVAGTGFAIQGATNAPTRLDAWANMYTSNAGVSVQGTVQNLATTTATPLVTGTPSAITTVFPADIYGSIQNGASTSTLTILAFTGNVSDSITVQAGSYCSVSP
jgi:hypothetical protein